MAFTPLVNQAGVKAQDIFCDLYVANGGNATQAAIGAGYSQKSAGELGRKLLKSPKIQLKIKQLNMQRLGGELAIKALGVLEAIMVDEEAPASARVDCAKTLLDRAGYKAGGEGANSQKPLQEMSATELMDIINNYTNKIKDIAQDAQAVEGEIIEADSDQASD